MTTPAILTGRLLREHVVLNMNSMQWKICQVKKSSVHCFGAAMIVFHKRENSNSKTLFYKDCSLGLVKTLSNN